MAAGTGRGDFKDNGWNNLGFPNFVTVGHWIGRVGAHHHNIGGNAQLRKPLGVIEKLIRKDNRLFSLQIQLQDRHCC